MAAIDHSRVFSYLTILQMTEASKTFQVLDKRGITIYVDVTVHNLRSVSTLVLEICPALGT